MSALAKTRGRHFVYGEKMMQYVGGIDVGGSSVKIGIVECGREARILRQDSIEMRDGESAEIIVTRIGDTLRQLAESCDVTLEGVGVGCAGLVDPCKGIVLKSPNIPSVAGFPLRDELQQRIRIPVEIQNDASAAVLGEFLFGPNKGIKNIVLFTLGTGVGGGVIADGKLLHGASNGAAELGHIKIEPKGEMCGCGKRGCVEAYVGTAGIARIARQQMRLRSGPKTVLDRDYLDTKTIAAAAANGDPTAKEILRLVGQYLGRAIATVIDVFNPQKVLLGGGASAAIEWLHPGIQQAMNDFASFPETRDTVRVERATSPETINLLGAAATFLQARSDPAPVSVIPTRPHAETIGGREECFALGLHIGASSYHVGLLDYSGTIIAQLNHHESVESRGRKTYEELLGEVVAAADVVIGEAASKGVSPQHIRGAGLVVPVPVNHKTGYIGRAPAIRALRGQFLNRDLQPLIQDRTGLNLEVHVSNDANGSCLAEWFFGAGRNQHDLVIMLLCTGLGGALLLRNELYTGHSHSAGEIGHMVVLPDGVRCGCGNRGCLETEVSGQALVRLAQEMNLVSELKREETYIDLIRRAKEERGEWDKVFTRMGKFLGIGLASLINVLNPARVVLTGRFTNEAFDLIWPFAKDEMKLRVFSGVGCDVVRSETNTSSEVVWGLCVHLYAQGVRP